jgi:hypothetical protein
VLSRDFSCQVVASNAEHVTHGLFLSVGLIRFAAIRYVTIHEILSAVAMSESRNLNALPTDNNGAWSPFGFFLFDGIRHEYFRDQLAFQPNSV